MSTFAENLRRVARQPEKGARLVARTFYRELRGAGFGDREIMAIADEMLGCLTAHLRLYRLKKEVPAGGFEDGLLLLAPEMATMPRGDGG